MSFLFAKNWTRIALLSGVVLAGVAAGSQAAPDDGNDGQIPSPQAIDGFFSRRLRANFIIEEVEVPGFRPVDAARLVSDPDRNSPLHDLGLEQGDVITRLDGVPVSNERELDRHFARTTVRYVKQGTSRVREGEIFIRGGRGGGGGGGGGGGPTPP